jgi:hypothetical protein
LIHRCVRAHGHSPAGAAFGGNSNAEIAKELFVGATTVKTHVGRVLTKLGLRDRIEAVIYAYEGGLPHPRHARHPRTQDWLVPVCPLEHGPRANRLPYRPPTTYRVSASSRAGWTSASGRYR